MMEPRIEILTEKKLVGKKMIMSLSDNKTHELWRSFMKRRKEIKNNVNGLMFSMQVYKQPFEPDNYNEEVTFEKWAAVEVPNFDMVPADMETFTLPGGLYAVFYHKGAALSGAETFRYIFGTWLPDSEFLLDHRPHFEILGEKYKNDDPDSEEEIWIPVRSKKYL